MASKKLFQPQLLQLLSQKKQLWHWQTRICSGLRQTIRSHWSGKNGLKFFVPMTAKKSNPLNELARTTWWDLVAALMECLYKRRVLRKVVRILFLLLRQTDQRHLFAGQVSNKPIRNCYTYLHLWSYCKNFTLEKNLIFDRIQVFFHNAPRNVSNVWNYWNGFAGKCDLMSN